MNLVLHRGDTDNSAFDLPFIFLTAVICVSIAVIDYGKYEVRWLLPTATHVVRIASALTPSRFSNLCLTIRRIVSAAPLAFELQQLGAKTPRRVGAD